MPSKRGGNTTPKKSSKFTVEGKSVEDLLKTGSTFLNRLTLPHLRQVVNRLSSAANKRLRRAQANGMDNSPAIREAMRSGGKFSSKDKDKEELKQEFIRLKTFFRDPTSTQAGWTRVKEQAEREAKRRGIIKETGPKETAKKPPAWEYSPDTDTYYNPEYGGGFTLDEVTDTFINMETGEFVENTKMYHDRDATLDWRFTEKGTETGDIWQAVDDIAKLDPRFASKLVSYDARRDLFDAIDNAWTMNEGWTLEQARDAVIDQLDKIYKTYEDHISDAMELGISRFFRD